MRSRLPLISEVGQRENAWSQPCRRIVDCVERGEKRLSQPLALTPCDGDKRTLRRRMPVSTQLDRLGRFEHACASFISSNEFEKASGGCELSTKLPTLPETFSTGGFWGWTKSTLAANLRALPEQIEAAQAHVEAAFQIDWDAGNAVLRENEKGVKPGVRAVELGAGIRRRYFLEENKFTGSNGGLMFTPNA
jgi:hypothetical protein